MNTKVSARMTALDAIEKARLTSTQLISSEAWERLVTVAWDNQSAPGDRRRIRAELVAILDQEANQISGDQHENP